MKNFFFFFLFLVSLSLQAKSVQLSSFNLGLAHDYVPYAKERLPLIIEKLKDGQDDLLCLQEVWEEDDRKAIVEGLKLIYPYAHFSAIENTLSKKVPACTLEELFGKSSFLRCMITHCQGKDGAEFTDCLLNRCQENLVSLKNKNRECASALMAQVGRNVVLGILSLLNPFQGAGLFAYGGGDGLLILSKRPLKVLETIDLSDLSTLNRRRALVVESEILGRPREIVCTHLTADLSAQVPYPGIFSSWEEENFRQSERIVNVLKSRPAASFMMGDLNCSFPLDRNNIAGSFQKSCELYLKSGWADSWPEKECSFCRNNPIVSGTRSDYLIDHIFTRELKGHLSIWAKEVFALPRGNNTLTIPLSDHYGVRWTFQSDLIR